MRYAGLLFTPLPDSFSDLCKDGVKLRNLQGSSLGICSSLSCVVFDATGERKWTEVTRMTTSEKLARQMLHKLNIKQ